MMNSVTENKTEPQTEPKTETESDWLFIGRITGAHGLNGHVKVFAETDFPERFTQPGERWLQKPNGGKPESVRILNGRFVEGKNHYIVKLEGVNYRDQAEDLRQSRLMVPASDRLELEPGEFHVSDLIGSTVIMQSDQSVIGTVTDVFTTGHDMLEVLLADQGDSEPVEAKEPSEIAETIAHPSTRAKAARKLKLQAKRKQKKKAPKTLFIPFVEEIVPVVDIAAGRIEVTPPPGLIDLA